jgi:hypothetical protein
LIFMLLEPATYVSILTINMYVLILPINTPCKHVWFHTHKRLYGFILINMHIVIIPLYMYVLILLL